MIDAPTGSPTSENARVLTGTSTSEAVAVKLNTVNSSTDRSPTGSNTGGTFTSFTVTVIVSESLRPGDPSSVTTTSNVYDPAP